MTLNPYISFISLVEVDQKYDAQVKSLHELDVQCARYEAEFLEKKNECDIERLRIRELRKKIDEKELELKVLGVRERGKAAQLENVSNPREYTSLSQEIEGLIARQKQQEDEILQLLAVYEFEEKLVQNKADVLVVHQAEMEKKLEACTFQKKVIEATMNQLDEQRREYIKNVQPELLTKYEQMRAQISNPVVPVKNNVCTGCFYEVRPHDLIDVRHHKLVHCKECYRLLYSV